MPEPGITLKKMFFDGDYTGVIIHAFPSKTRPKTKKSNGKNGFYDYLYVTMQNGGGG